ncbi:hypothetical protein QLL95_gp0274 [Cotonvirus japonicus]|uniref:Uncharacterized protein n=1 Tax=Cotonvirus japonicus TaxID=2811091 RepID=A0ABM7NRH3_9VIRU|nr:hypothetical protein QLL95_gp0274 [Cotonvirus japonicus]BCS82763.1 hypothetical protein [Cotonvirus japonicus]
MYQNIESSINAFISKEFSKQIIPNRNNLDDVIENYLSTTDEDIDHIDDDELEKFCDKLYKRLEKTGKIYKVGDKDSYLQVVRSKGLISSTEYLMMKNIKLNDHKINFRDTEFNVGVDGRYIV